MTNLSHILDLPHNKLKEHLVTLGHKPFLADQMMDWVYRKLELNPEQWTNVSKAAKSSLPAQMRFNLPRILTVKESSDSTTKFLLGFEDGNSVETVLIPGPDRLTVCLSTQVGCAIGCTFCHTATQGLKRHLKPHEIVGQFMVAKKWAQENRQTEVTNIVYMGQGEPLHNFENCKTSAEIFMDLKGFGMGQRKITLSTSGLIPQLKRFHEFPPINLAVSLHSAFDDKRTELMPINKNYALDELIETLYSIPLKAYRRITFEYLLIKDFNDTAEDALMLAKLLKRNTSKLNLIPFNEYPGSKYQRPSDEQIHHFRDLMINYGFTCTVRYSKGDDILAACGQLKSQAEKSLVKDMH